MKHRLSYSLPALALLVAWGGAQHAVAATVPLGASGWVATWDPSLDPYVDIHVVAEDPSNVFIQKSAEFFQGPDAFGVYPGVSIIFIQVGPSTIQSIVIEDEILTNSTGTDWTDFHMDLVGPASFRIPQGGFFTTSPFDNQTLTPSNFSVNGFGLGPGGSNTTVPNGSSWFPGSGSGDGELYIDVPNSINTTFVLVETPTPEPATLALLSIGMCAVARRRR